MKDIYEVLRADHRRIGSLLEKLCDTGNHAVKTREDLFARLKREVIVHSQAEEQLFYPRLMEREELRDQVQEALEEHTEVKQLLAECEGIPKDDDAFIDKIQLIRESIEHHVEDEENELFKLAEDILEDEQANELGTRIEKFERQNMG